MELINSIFNFFTDKTKKLPHKVILFLVAILLICILDNILSFTFSYNNGNKIEQIEGINRILKDSSLSKLEEKKLIILRQNIINHNTWKDKTFDFFTNIEFANDSKDKAKNIQEKKINKPKIEINSNKQNKPKTRNYYWHFISSGWLFILLMIIFPFMSLFDKKTPFWQAVAIIIIIEPTFYGISWVYAKLFSLIPVILNNPTFNYILNTVLCFTSVVIIGLLNKKEN